MPVSTLFQRLSLDDEEILVVSQFSQDAVFVPEIVHDLPLDKRHEKRTPDIFHTLEDFLVVVNKYLAENHCIGFQLPESPDKPRLIIEAEGNQIVCPSGCQRAGIIQKLIRIDTLHLGAEDFSLFLNPDHRGLFGSRQMFVFHFFKQLRHIFRIFELFTDQFAEGIIHPQHTALLIEKSIRHGKFFQDFFLYLSVMCCKSNHLRHKTGCGPQVQNQDDQTVNQHKNGTYESYFRTETKCQNHCHGRPQHDHIERPLEIVFNFSRKLQRIIHASS